MKQLLFLLAVGAVLTMAACGTPQNEHDGVAQDGGRSQREYGELQGGGSTDTTAYNVFVLQNDDDMRVPAIAVGDIIRFGGHDWRVLDIDGSYAKILTEHIIFRRAYHGVRDSVTWEASDIRRYLNSDFYGRFAPNTRTWIRETQIVNNNNPWFGTNGGNDTTDKIFLLSIEEVVRYFGDSGQWENRPQDRQGHAAWWINDGYSRTRVARNAAGTAFWWWLRSPGYLSHNAAYVGPYGFLYMIGLCVSRDEIGVGVRPALWLNLESAPNHPLVGRWQSGDITLEFLRDGSGIFEETVDLSEDVYGRGRDSSVVTRNFTWSTAEGRLIKDWFNVEVVRPYHSEAEGKTTHDYFLTESTLIIYVVKS